MVGLKKVENIKLITISFLGQTKKEIKGEDFDVDKWTSFSGRSRRRH